MEWLLIMAAFIAGAGGTFLFVVPNPVIALVVGILAVLIVMGAVTVGFNPQAIISAILVSPLPP